MCDPVFHFRDKLAFTQSRAASYFFDGSSYAVVRDITRRGKFGQVTRFDIEVRTPADNGLVLLMVNGVSTNGSPPYSPLFIFFALWYSFFFWNCTPTYTRLHLYAVPSKWISSSERKIGFIFLQGSYDSIK